MQNVLQRSILVGAILIAQMGSPVAAFASDSSLQEFLGFLKKSGAVELVGEKSVTSPLLGTEKKSQIRALLSGARFRVESSGSEKLLVVYDGKAITIVEQGPDGSAQSVSRGEIGPKQRSQLVLSELLMGDRLLKSFATKSMGIKNGIETFQAIPQDKNFSLQMVKLGIHIEDNRLAELVYTDDIGNETRLVFSEQKVLKKPKSNQFTYVVKKGVVVNKL